MRAIVIDQYGPVEGLVYKEIPKPESMTGQVVIKIKAFGINHAEMHMRRGEWAESVPVSGIECVGIVDACPGSEFQVGDKVVTLMGGLGRTIPGSYAEYTRAPATNVVKVDTDLPWEQLAAIPESYATAWTCLFRNLQLTQGQLLVVRGGTSSFGQAAINMAVNAGARVIATTRSESRKQMLLDLGVERVEIERPDLSNHIAESRRIDAVLDLVGNSTILDSLAMLRRGGKACLAGWLGGLAPIPDFNPLLQMSSGVYLTFFGSFVFGQPQFPLTDVPLQDIVDQVAAGKYKARPSKVFRFEQIHDAHRAMEANQANGKMVVVVD
jgi:NADPH2:quinone reductase